MAEIADGAAKGKRIEIWFQDEARIGQKNKITRRWAKRGTRPSAPHDQRTRSADIFGAICPKLGKAAALVMPWCDTYAMTQHLAEIARHVACDAHAVLIVDQAGWHMSNTLLVPENITILPLPPKSPELNPVENLWLFMRENWLSNRVFKSYEDIVAHCCDAWRKLESHLGASCPSGAERLMRVKVRRGGRIASVAVIIAVGVNTDGRREVLAWRLAHQRPSLSGRSFCAN